MTIANFVQSVQISDFTFSLLCCCCISLAYYRIYALTKRRDEGEVSNEVISSLSWNPETSDDDEEEEEDSPHLPKSRIDKFATVVAFTIFFASIATAANFLSVWSSHCAKETLNLLQTFG